MSYTKSSSVYLREQSSSQSVTSPYYTTDRSTTSKLTKSRTGEVNPKWRQKVADGGNATTALKAYEQYAKIHPGYANYKPKDVPNAPWGKNTSLGIIGPYVLDPSVLTTPAFNSLANEAVAKSTVMINNQLTRLQAPFEGQVFAGELREVLDLIKHPLAGAAKLTENFIRLVSKDKSFRSAVRMTPKERAWRIAKNKLSPLPKNIADAWLEYSFALSPLLSDIDELLALAETVSERNQHETIKGYGVKQSATDVVSAGSTGTTGLTVRYEVIEIDKVQSIIRCGLTKEFLTEVRGVADIYRNSIDDLFTIPSMFWERLPWSFLYDYFVNIGDLVGSAAVSQSGIAWTSNTTIRSKEIRRIAGAPYISRPDLISQIGAYQTKMVVYGVRSVTRTSTFAGIPPVVVHLPGSKLQYANMLALLINLTK